MSDEGGGYVLIVLHDGMTVKMVIQDAADVVVEESDVYWNGRKDSLLGVQREIMVLPDSFTVKEGDAITSDMILADEATKSISLDRQVNQLMQRIDALEARIAELEARQS
jgi:uncharacterized protein YacL (UPF0231 family)